MGSDRTRDEADRAAMADRLSDMAEHDDHCTVLAGRAPRCPMGELNQLFADEPSNDGQSGDVPHGGVPVIDGSATGTKLNDGTLWPDPHFVADASWWLRYGDMHGGCNFSKVQRFGVSSALNALLTLATHPCGVEMLRRYRAHVGAMVHACAADDPSND